MPKLFLRMSAQAAAQYPRAPSGAAQLASDKSALSNPSAISRTGRGSASSFHISYLISHNFHRPPKRLRPRSHFMRRQPLNSRPRRLGPFETATPPTLAEPNGRHFQDASASTLAERPTGATLLTI